jgi:hypothetical protein
MKMPRRSRWLVLLLALLALVAPPAAVAAPPSRDATAYRLVTGLEGGSGSTIGPDGALYVTENAAGRITRVDPRTGATTTFASGLPKLIPAAGFGGPVDITFVGRTAYVLVTLVGPDVGGSDVVGLYRVDGPDRFSVVADIGAFSINHPPATDFFVPSGVQYALQAYRGGLLVTDGHHNRVLRVTRGGQINVLIAFDNIVPTGLTARWCRSGRRPTVSGRSPRAVPCWLMWSLAAGTGCTPSPRASGLVAPRVLRRCRTPAPW